MKKVSLKRTKQVARGIISVVTLFRSLKKLLAPPFSSIINQIRIWRMQTKKTAPPGTSNQHEATAANNQCNCKIYFNL